MHLRHNDIDEVKYSEAKGREYVTEMRSKFTLKTTFTYDANYAKQKHKQMSACLQLNMDEDEDKSALSSGCWLVVGL